MSLERIQELKEKLKKAETLKITNEANQKSAEEAITKIEEEMRELGVTPETICEKIAGYEAAIAENLSSLEKLIPDV